MDDIAIIENKIYEIRGQKVMLDFDLAEMYGVVPVLITAKVAAIAAITAVGEVTVRDTTMTVHKEAIVLVRVPAIMIRMLSIA